MFCKSFRCALFVLHFGRQTPHIGLLCCGFVASLSTKIASSPPIFPSGSVVCALPRPRVTTLLSKSFRCALFVLHFGRQTPHIGLLCCGFVALLSAKIASSPTIFTLWGKLLILHFAFPHRTFFFRTGVIILHFQLTKVENIAKKFNFLRKILQNRKKVVPLRLERWQSGRMRRS